MSILAAPANAPGPRRAIVVTCAMAGSVMQTLDSTIANVALPFMQGSLSASLDQVNWVLTSYIVAAAIMTAPVGWLAARFGRKRLFVTCTATFTISSILCGMSQDLTQLVIFRLFQGAAGAALIPLSQSLVIDLYPAHERTKAQSIFGMGIMLGPIMGPTLGAWLTDQYSWHWVFLVNVPFGLIATIGLFIFMEESPPNDEAEVRLVRLRGAGDRHRRAAARARPRRAGRLVRFQRDHRLCDRLGGRHLLLLRPLADHAGAVRPLRPVQGSQLRLGLHLHGGDGGGAVLDHGAGVAVPAAGVRASGAGGRHDPVVARRRHVLLDDADPLGDALRRGAHDHDGRARHHRLHALPDVRPSPTTPRPARSSSSACCRVLRSAWCSSRSIPSPS